MKKFSILDEYWKRLAGSPEPGTPYWEGEFGGPSGDPQWDQAMSQIPEDPEADMTPPTPEKLLGDHLKGLGFNSDKENPSWFKLGDNGLSIQEVRVITEGVFVVAAHSIKESGAEYDVIYKGQLSAETQGIESKIGGNGSWMLFHTFAESADIAAVMNSLEKVNSARFEFERSMKTGEDPRRSWGMMNRLSGSIVNTGIESAQWIMEGEVMYELGLVRDENDNKRIVTVMAPGSNNNQIHEMDQEFINWLEGDLNGDDPQAEQAPVLP